MTVKFQLKDFLWIVPNMLKYLTAPGFLQRQIKKAGYMLQFMHAFIFWIPKREQPPAAKKIAAQAAPACSHCRAGTGNRLWNGVKRTFAVFIFRSHLFLSFRPQGEISSIA